MTNYFFIDSLVPLDARDVFEVLPCAIAFPMFLLPLQVVQLGMSNPSKDRLLYIVLLGIDISLS